MVIIVAAFNVTGLSVNRIMSKPAFQLTLEMALTPLCEVNKNGIMPAVASGQRVISYEVIEKEDIKIENLIYEIRGKQVMLDSDLAKLYQVETKRINEAVKNNPEKFPERFSWILSNEEYETLRSKILTSKILHTQKQLKPMKTYLEIYEYYFLLLDLFLLYHFYIGKVLLSHYQASLVCLLFHISYFLFCYSKISPLDDSTKQLTLYQITKLLFLKYTIYKT